MVCMYVDMSVCMCGSVGGCTVLTDNVLERGALVYKCSHLSNNFHVTGFRVRARALVGGEG